MSVPIFVAGRRRDQTLGYMVLIEAAFFCICGAPFDIEVTPKFARMLDEAERAWPPTSPVEWPPKDW